MKGDFCTPTQRAMIKAHLLKYGSITPVEALREYSCYRLGAVVYLLRHRDGWDIKTWGTRGKNKFGRPCRNTRYELISKPSK